MTTTRTELISSLIADLAAHRERSGTGPARTQ